MFPPPPSPSTRRAPARLALAAAALALVLLAGCTTRSTPDSYGETTRRNFLSGCQDTSRDEGMANAEARSYCVCTYEAIVDRIPFEEFKEINDDLSDEPGPLPDRMLAIRDECLDEPA